MFCRLSRPAWSGGELRGFRPDTSGGKRGQHPSSSVGRWVQSANNAALDSQYTSVCTFTFMLLHIPNKSTQGSSVADPWHFSADPDVRLTNGSRCGSWRPKIMRILRIRIRNRNTGSQIKSHKKLNKTVPVEIKVFLTSFAWWWWKVPEPVPYLWLTDPYLWLTEPDADPGGPKTYRS